MLVANFPIFPVSYDYFYNKKLNFNETDRSRITYGSRSNCASNGFDD